MALLHATHPVVGGSVSGYNSRTGAGGEPINTAGAPVAREELRCEPRLAR